MTLTSFTTTWASCQLATVLAIAPSALMLSATPGSEAQELAAPLSLAVLDIASPAGSPDLGPQVATLLAAHLSTSEHLLLVERSDIDAILGESELTLSGTVDTNTAPKIGQLLGAQVLVTGSVIPSGDGHLAVAKLISTQNGRVIAGKAKLGPGGDLSDEVEELAANLDRLVAERGGELTAGSESPEARIERLRKLVAGRPLPSVYVHIPETHLTRTVPDPAAQTEIELTLQQIGAKVVDSPSKADVTIGGEAFSERAGSLGNLVTCRARLEVAASKKSSPDAKWVARETVGAADLAENTAAKAALQKAGARVAESLLPFLLN